MEIVEERSCITSASATCNCVREAVRVDGGVVIGCELRHFGVVVKHISI